ncbi:hypothetical protein H1P_2920008 [Hyella patelloides LEGE 07179]|uniref:Response regulatory domain-containing protein n=1 Tax=Hyella patelloides LEGE 07179 TaxID=945734 RepID=A0A563VTY1_9CYAN|nr:response regulator [Hyella patelloides]VEP14863.1 hypothetical protein H1P_2920008 [Hyella patelloides LEGE 07179]
MSDKTVLVIDDNPDFNILVKFVLEHDTNWNILTASDGEEGVAQAQLQQPNLILLDVIMPNLNGLDVYRLLKTHPTTCFIPIVFVTAMPEIAKIIKLQIAEDIEIVIKPFDIMTLADRVIDICDRCIISGDFRIPAIAEMFQEMSIKDLLDEAVRETPRKSGTTP